ncbi:MAG: hypothetical protein CMA10_07115 [Euryarchaeota archaeon]|nr:hypothetical protein [Euryarchaeota archaeon]
MHLSCASRWWAGPTDPKSITCPHCATTLATRFQDDAESAESPGHVPLLAPRDSAEMFSAQTRSRIIMCVFWSLGSMFMLYITLLRHPEPDHFRWPQVPPPYSAPQTDPTHTDPDTLPMWE